MQSIQLAAAAALVGFSTALASAALLFDNGPIITNPTGGTGAIAGQPISQPERLARPGDGLLVTTSLGRTARGTAGHALGDDFVVPEPGWDLDSLTVYGFELRTASPPLSVPSIDRVHVNLWTAKPFSATSPPPIPDPLPQPVLATRLVLPVQSWSLIGYRTGGATSTTSIGTIFALNVSLSDLPEGGKLDPGSYWLEWAFEDSTRPTVAPAAPLITPRASAFNLDGRQFNSIDNLPSTPLSWFEARDGFVDGVSDGLAMAFPFTLNGTVLPEPISAAILSLCTFLRRRRL